MRPVTTRQARLIGRVTKTEKLPRENSNDSAPMWVGDRIYFLSDREGPVTLFSFDPATRAVKRELPASGLDIKAASAGPGSGAVTCMAQTQGPTMGTTSSQFPSPVSGSSQGDPRFRHPP